MAESELHLFIIWEKARNMEDKILQTIQANFQILEIRNIKWPPKTFSRNLTRFYGENLPSSSKKIQECGDGEFVLVIVEDNAPLYKPRLTSKGCKTVNANMFDAKELFRFWTGGGSKIHGTNSKQEVDHDLTLLIGMNSEDYRRSLLPKTSENEMVVSRSESELFGAHGWVSVNDFFYALNNCIDYVVLRNYEELPEKVTMGEHGDIDFLCSNLKQMVLVTNARPIFRNKDRVRYTVSIGGENLFCDFRHIGDGYYDEKWEKSLISSRIKFKDAIYIPNAKEQFYSLLYHALIQKFKIADDYKVKIKAYGKLVDMDINTDSRKEMIDILMNYLKENQYSVSEPNDYSVLINLQEVNAKYGFIYSMKRNIFKLTKKMARG